MTNEDPRYDVLNEAARLHAKNGHPPGYTGPCWGPTLAELKRAERNVRIRRRELLESIRRARQGWHWHTCLRRECRRRYRCGNACDKRFLSDSLCDVCFDEVLRT